MASRAMEERLPFERSNLIRLECLDLEILYFASSPDEPLFAFAPAEQSESLYPGGKNTALCNLAHKVF